MKNKIANVLKEIRKQKNFTPEYVSNQLKSKGINIAAKTLYGYENGINHINADTFLYLCKIYGIEDFGIFFDETTETKVTSSLYDKLNDIGKQKAEQYIEDLSINPKYRKEAQTAVQASPVYEIAAYGADNSTEVTFTTRPIDIT